ncbi:MAG: hypothetical protein KatS3mg060_0310 [Dehalococcoidia bacterium]|nr:MAG: hypothetical protein KatS3mg060_0310 [Dehalococcoidia bacterium]
MRPTIQCLGWFMRRTHDPADLAAFYRDVVGLPVIRTPREDVHIFWGGEATSFEILLGGSPPPPISQPEDAPCIPILRTVDFDAARARLGAGGARFLDHADDEPDGRTAYFLDPHGHLTGLRERRRTSPWWDDHEAWRRYDTGETRIPGVGPMPPDLHGIGWVALRVQDVAAETAFYRDSIGLAAIDERPERGLLALGDTLVLEILPGGAPARLPAERTEVANVWMLRVRDLDGIVADLKAQGVRFVNEVFELTGGRLCYIADPENRLVGIQDHPPDGLRAEEDEAGRRWQRLLRARGLTEPSA